jgi:fructuronate reductase
MDSGTIKNIYKKHKNRSLTVVLENSGKFEKELIASIGSILNLEANENGKQKKTEVARAERVFTSPSLQLVTYTITEKGYALKDLGGRYLPDVKAEIDGGPDFAKTAMGTTAALLYKRYLAGRLPIAMVSTDNFSRNGEKLKDSLLTIVREWVKTGKTEPGFLDYMENPKKVAFPLTVIDRITPNPDPAVSQSLSKSGYADARLMDSSRGVHIATFVNTEKACYLVIEDDFPNGRPPLEKAGVRFTTAEMVDAFEKMKVCTCLNPLHTCLAILGCLLGYTKISEEMKDDQLVDLLRRISYKESMRVVADPKVIKPVDFLEECINTRFANPYLPDTPQRIATDTSQKLPIRYGVTLREWAKRPDLDISSLTYIPFVFAAWFRYLLGVDDEGNPFELSPDPLLKQLAPYFEGLSLGMPKESYKKVLPLLKDETLFGMDLDKAGLLEKTEEYFYQLTRGKNAVRSTLTRLLEKH